MPVKRLTEIYLALLGEGVEVWRPVQAIHIGKDIYEIISSNPDPEDEHWQFHPGDFVRCKDKVFADGTKGKVAYKLAKDV